MDANGKSNLATWVGIVAILAFLWSISGKIDAVNERLSDKIDAVEQRLGNKFDELNRSVGRIKGRLEGRSMAARLVFGTSPAKPVAPTRESDRPSPQLCALHDLPSADG